MTSKSGYHHGSLREALIRETTNALRTVPIAEISVRRLSAACGVSVAAVYRHFDSKQDLLRSVQHGLLDDLVRSSRQPHPGDLRMTQSDGSVADDLVATVYAYLSLAMREPNILHAVLPLVAEDAGSILADGGATISANTPLIRHLHSLNIFGQASVAAEAAIVLNGYAMAVASSPAARTEAQVRMISARVAAVMADLLPLDSMARQPLVVYAERLRAAV